MHDRLFLVQRDYSPASMLVIEFAMLSNDPPGWMRWLESQLS